MSEPRLLTQTEIEALRRGTDVAWLRYLMRPNFWARRSDEPRYRKFYMGGLHEVAWPLESAVKYGDESRLTDRKRLLFRIYTNRIPLYCPEVDRALSAARREGDEDFWKSLRQLDRGGTFDDSKMGRLERLLLTHWDVSRDGLPPLYHFSSRNLELIVQEKLNRQPMDVETLKKVRQRLRLPTVRLEKIWATRGKNGLEIIWRSQART